MSKVSNPLFWIAPIPVDADECMCKPLIRNPKPLFGVEDTIVGLVLELIRWIFLVISPWIYILLFVTILSLNNEMVSFINVDANLIVSPSPLPPFFD